jgi:hypothetical protein
MRRTRPPKDRAEDKPANPAGAEKPKPKDWWDKADILGKLVIVPVLTGLVLLFANRYVESMREESATVGYAVQILLQPQTAENAAQRAWAVEVIDKHSDVALGDKVRAELNRTVSASDTAHVTESATVKKR